MPDQTNAHERFNLFKTMYHASYERIGLKGEQTLLDAAAPPPPKKVFFCAPTHLTKTFPSFSFFGEVVHLSLKLLNEIWNKKLL